MDWLQQDILENGKDIVSERFGNVEIKIVCWMDRIYYFKVEDKKVNCFKELN